MLGMVQSFITDVTAFCVWQVINVLEKSMDMCVGIITYYHYYVSHSSERW